MKSLPSELLDEKNKLATPNAWLLFMDVVLPDEDATEFHLVNNTEDLTFQGQLYTAINFDIDPDQQSSKGEIPTLSLRVSNVTRILQAYLEELNGALGANVTLRIVNTANLASNYTELTLEYDVLGAETNDLWVTFHLGAPNPLRRRFPLYRYIANHCGWSYKSAECAYAGVLLTCKRTLTDCRLHANSKRYGGFPGLNGAVRLA
jgi:lambda family phage minor tail protein L